MKSDECYRNIRDVSGADTGLGLWKRFVAIYGVGDGRDFELLCFLDRGSIGLV